MSKVYISFLLVFVGCLSSPAPQNPTGKGDSGSVCLASGTVCTSTPNACCSGVCSVDETDPTQPETCAATCSTGSDCESGCCATTTNTEQMICAPIGFCTATCKAPGATCVTAEDCCVDNGDPQQCVAVTGGEAICAAECTTGAQCESGCCAPLTNLSVSVCAAAQFCN